MRFTLIVVAKLFLCLSLVVTAASAAEQVDLIVHNGVIYDGSGGAPTKGDVAVRDGRVVASGSSAELATSGRLGALYLGADANPSTRH